MFDSGDVLGEQKTMADYTLNDVLNLEQTKIIYVYDFINMWTFLVELAAVEEPVIGETYPALLFSHGELPAEAIEKQFEAENQDDYYSEFEDDIDEDDLDAFGSDDSFEDYGFEENWN
jgi:hypothetical protein